MTSSICPSEYFADDDNYDAFKQRFNSGIDPLQITTGLEPMTTDPTGAAFVSYVDGLHDADENQWYATKYVVASLPSDTIAEHYGSDALVWTAANAVYEELVKSHARALPELTGHDNTIFEKSRLWCWRKQGSTQGRNVLAQLALTETTLAESVENIDVPSLLHTHAREDVTISDKRASDYSLVPITTYSDLPQGYVESNWEVPSDIDYSVYIDAPAGVILTYKDHPNAVASFADSDPDKIMIYQLQGIKGTRLNPKGLEQNTNPFTSARGLAPIDWRGFMIDVVSEIARKTSAQQLAVQSGENNKWTQVYDKGETEPHLPLASAQRNYDVPAQQNGFTLSDQDGNWHKSL